MIHISSKSDDEDEDEEDVHFDIVLLENDNNNKSITTTKEDDEEEDFDDDDDDDEETDIEYDPEYDDFDYDNDCDSQIGQFTFRTTGFKVCKLDTTTESEPKWRRVDNLDGEALFLGFSQSFSISQPHLLGYKEDRIYFTDDDNGAHLYLHSGNDMGVFKLEDSSFEPLYSTDSDSTKPPAVWITPTSCVTVHQPGQLEAMEYQEHLQLRRPGLMIPGTNDINNTFSSSQTRRFLPFPIGKVISQEHYLPHLAVPHEHLCRGSYEGWLVMVEKDMSVYLLNPFSGTRIDLPPVTALPKPRLVDTLMSKWYVHKAIMSASPFSSSTTDECIIMVVYGRDDLAFCKLGDKTWTPIEFPRTFGHVDAIYHKGMFHVVTDEGVVSTCDITAKKPKIIQFDPPSKRSTYMEKWYLAESSKGELLQILRNVKLLSSTKNEDEDGDENAVVGDELLDYCNGSKDETTTDSSSDEENEDEDSDDDDDDEETDIDYDDEYDESDYENNFTTSSPYFTSHTTGFKVIKLDDTTGSKPEWRIVNNLDGEALFLGLNQAFSIAQPHLLGYKSDRIYFTDDHIPDHKLSIRSGNDMGVFNIEDSTIEPLYSTDSDSTKPPAVWITPTNCLGTSMN